MFQIKYRGEPFEDSHDFVVQTDPHCHIVHVVFQDSQKDQGSKDLRKIELITKSLCHEENEESDNKSCRIPKSPLYCSPES